MKNKYTKLSFRLNFYKILTIIRHNELNYNGSKNFDLECNFCFKYPITLLREKKNTEQIYKLKKQDAIFILMFKKFDLQK